ncbi:MAG: hypothetical protein WDN69_21320 [Aliidongia sp.]
MNAALARAPYLALTVLCLAFGPLIYVSARGATLGMLLIAAALLLVEPGRAGTALGRAGWRL